MIVEKKVVTTMILMLDDEESSWLHAVMRNPLWNTLITQETKRDEIMRQRFFSATAKGKEEQ